MDGVEDPVVERILEILRAARGEVVRYWLVVDAGAPTLPEGAKPEDFQDMDVLSAHDNEAAAKAACPAGMHVICEEARLPIQ